MSYEAWEFSGVSAQIKEKHDQKRLEWLADFALKSAERKDDSDLEFFKAYADEAETFIYLEGGLSSVKAMNKLNATPALVTHLCYLLEQYRQKERANEYTRSIP